MPFLLAQGRISESGGIWYVPAAATVDGLLGVQRVVVPLSPLESTVELKHWQQQLPAKEAILHCVMILFIFKNNNNYYI